MVTPLISENRFSQEFASRVRRFFRWITKPEVALAIIMLALMIYLIIIPLYRMAATTLTIQAKDLVTHPEAAEGDFTLIPLVENADLENQQDHAVCPTAAFNRYCFRSYSNRNVPGMRNGLVRGQNRYAGQKTDQRSGHNPLYVAVLDDIDGMDRGF